jgi:hypothetical protein
MSGATLSCTFQGPKLVSRQRAVFRLESGEAIKKVQDLTSAEIRILLHSMHKRICGSFGQAIVRVDDLRSGGAAQSGIDRDLVHEARDVHSGPPPAFVAEVDLFNTIAPILRHEAVDL